MAQHRIRLHLASGQPISHETIERVRRHFGSTIIALDLRPTTQSRFVDISRNGKDPLSVSQEAADILERLTGIAVTLATEQPDLHKHSDGRTMNVTHSARGVEVSPLDEEEVCDFCLVPNPTWQYPCHDFEIIGNPFAEVSTGDWLACDNCHQLIETGDVKRMVQYMVRTQRQKPLPPRWRRQSLSSQLAVQAQNIKRFLHARNGDAIPLIPSEGSK